MRASLACLVTSLLAGPLPARAKSTVTPVPLGAGTACAVMSEQQTRALLGVRKRHAIVCADPAGMVTRVLISRKGVVECTDTVHVLADRRESAGPPCRDIPVRLLTEAPTVVNLTGTWSATSSLWTCNWIEVVQNGSSLSLSGNCGVMGAFAGNGTIDFDGDRFISSGTATVTGIGPCRSAGMDAQASPDGQSVAGTVSCDLYSIPFTASRVQ